MIVTQYRITAICDTCGKRDIRTADTPAGSPVPTDWIQAAPPGLTEQKEFCSIDCFSNWSNPIMPWEDE